MALYNAWQLYTGKYNGEIVAKGSLETIEKKMGSLPHCEDTETSRYDRSDHLVEHKDTHHYNMSNLHEDLI